MSAAALLRAVLARRGVAELTSARPVVVAALVQLLLDGPRSDYAMAVSAAVLLELTGAADAGWAAAVRAPPQKTAFTPSVWMVCYGSRRYTATWTRLPHPAALSLALAQGQPVAHHRSARENRFSGGYASLFLGLLGLIWLGLALLC